MREGRAGRQGGKAGQEGRAGRQGQAYEMWGPGQHFASSWRWGLWHILSVAQRRGGGG